MTHRMSPKTPPNKKPSYLNHRTSPVLFCTIYVSWPQHHHSSCTQLHRFDANAARLRYTRAKPEHNLTVMYALRLSEVRRED
eukprot:scaffold9761_cov118-Isochrysis_galbana.AAC.1